jgi:hypothetical protein
VARSEWQTFRKTDEGVITSFDNIVAGAAPGVAANTQIRLTQTFQTIITSPLAEVRSQPLAVTLLAANQALAESLVLSFSLAGSGATVSVRREPKESTDKISIDYPDSGSGDGLLKVLTAVGKEFPTYARAESVDRLLGDELAEFYRAREAGLLRLESLSQRLTEDTDKYRQTLDARFDDRNKQLEEQLGQRTEQLQASVSAERERLAQQERELAERQKNLDDRDSRHARRALRADLQRVLKERDTEFRLTTGTGKKRVAVHLLYSSLIVVLVAVLAIELWKFDAGTASNIRLALTFAATVATFILYIRWSDQWFRQHADEEFRLKRMGLDVDRASWVVETALEWQQQNQGPIPAQLLEQLSRDLFTAGPASSPIRHPAEDLAAAILSASSSLRINLPGVGEATLDRKGVQRLQGAMGEGAAGSE